MIKRSVCLSTLLILASLGHEAAFADPALLRTIWSLDEARGYCLDIPGFGAGIRLEENLQAHTCKYGESVEDQLFERDAGEPYVRAAAYDRCLTATAHAVGAEVNVQTCVRSALQQWEFAWGRLSPASRPDLCLSLAPAGGEITGTPVLISPVYRRRGVSLQLCADELESLQGLRWSPPGERGLSTVDVARRGMPDEAAAELDRLGRAFSGAIARQTRTLLAAAPKSYAHDELEIAADIAYGPHDAQRLDIYTATARPADRLRPAVIIFHGGGLIGGDRSTTANAAEYFASLGFVGVNGTYRRAPEAQWPEGGRDVATAVTWLHGHIADYGGDPGKIFVMGLSTGAFHAATYVFRPELMPSGTPRAAGTMLLSGPYTFDFENPTEGEVAYFGADPARYAEMVILGNVTATDIPVLLTTAEWDIARYTVPFAALLDELISGHGVIPRYGQNLGHNHVSQVSAIGTSDTTVSALLIDFIRKTIAAAD